MNRRRGGPPVGSGINTHGSRWVVVLVGETMRQDRRDSFRRFLCWAMRRIEGKCLIIVGTGLPFPPCPRWDPMRVLAFGHGQWMRILLRKAADRGAIAAAIPGDSSDPYVLPLPMDRAVIHAFLQGPAAPLEANLRERIARLIHERYVARRRMEGVSDDPSLAAWEALGEGLKESNRAQADDIASKLRLLGLRMVEQGTTESGGWLPPFSRSRTEFLAEIEHGRWVVERLLAGWRLGPRDPEARRSSYLVAWNDLPHEIKEYDREAVREIPALLRHAGIRVAPFSS